MRRVVLALAAVCASAVCVPIPALAQERASIVGVVQDSTGAVMPGVTVEAASPALIEQVRTAVTDSSGRYAVIDLRPGTYTVTFTLPGFKAVKREGIVLEGAFTAQVNIALSVGAVEETVTVTGQSPIVDTQSTQNQAVLNRNVLDVLPAARTMQGGAALVPGVSFYSQGFVSTMSIHGSATADQHIFFDGMNIGQNLTGTGSQGNGVTVNELAQTELVYDAGSQSAENPLGGVRMDSIPKEGGNTLRRRLAHARLARLVSERQHHERAEAVHLGQHAARLQLRHERGLRRPDQEEQAVVPVRAARVAHQQPHRVSQRRAAELPQRHTGGVGRLHRAARDGALDGAGDAEEQGRLGVLQVAGRHAAVRRRLRRHEQQRGRLHRAGSGVCAAAAAAVRQPGEVDLADQQPAAARGRAVAGGADVQLQLPAGERTARHPAPQCIDRAADDRLEYGALPLLQSDLEHGRQHLVRDRLAQHEVRPEPPGGLSDQPDRAARRHVAAELHEQRGWCPDAGVRHAAEHAVHATGKPQRESRRVRAGQMDAQSADGDLRRSLRLLQRRHAAAIGGGRPLHLGGGRRGPQVDCAGEMPAVLERLGGSRRRVLRPVRHRQDRA